jgi:uncharacterized protein YdaU (DUF1376 family)
MTVRPYIPIWIADYLNDTQLMHGYQHGPYLLLIFHYWQNGSLPTDDRHLAKITHLSLRQWLRMKPSIVIHFDDKMRHKRIDFEIKKHDDLILKRTLAGAKGGTMKAFNRNRRSDH